MVSAWAGRDGKDVLCEMRWVSCTWERWGRVEAEVVLEPLERVTMGKEQEAIKRMK